MSAPVLVVGGSGEVGEGIVGELIDEGREVIAAARSAGGLAALADRLGDPARLRTLTGTVSDLAAAARLAEAAGTLGAVVVAVNANREATRLDALSPDALAERLNADLLTHFVAVRTFLPLLPPDGCLVGIGGGAADFILDGGVHLSMAQAALRQMYRGMAHEQPPGGAALRELIVASVVAGRRHGLTDPRWVIPREIGRKVADMIAAPGDYPGTVWRIARRDGSGPPVFGREDAAPARILPL